MGLLDGVAAAVRGVHPGRVIFDFGRSSLDLGEKETRPGEPEQTLDVQVEFREAPPEAQSLSRLSGVYVDTDRLQAGVETASQALAL